ncbi:MAG TPA: hypothetical protein P5525_11300 [Candidatus Paceibacterota bacterium]|nr:hypothetical protein [Candidatus Paceibacterota bacterium]
MAKVRPQPGEEIGIESLPNIQRAESDALLILEHMRDALGGGADDPKRETSTDAKRQTRESGNLAPGQGMLGGLPVFALDAPEIAVVGFRDEINALIGVGELELLANRLRHFPMQPDVLELAGVFRLQEQIGFDEFFEHVALLLLGQGAQLALEVVPRSATLDRIKQSFG